MNLTEAFDFNRWSEEVGEGKWLPSGAMMVQRKRKLIGAGGDITDFWETEILDLKRQPLAQFFTVTQADGEKVANDWFHQVRMGRPAPAAQPAAEEKSPPPMRGGLREIVGPKEPKKPL